MYLGLFEITMFMVYGFLMVSCSQVKTSCESSSALGIVTGSYGVFMLGQLYR